MEQNITALVQARMGSTRLPGKVLRPLVGYPMLYWLIERLKRAERLKSIAIVTTTDPINDPLVDFCAKFGITLYRFSGDESDLLGRYAAAARALDSAVIVRICSDCPLIDPEVVDCVVREYLESAPAVDYCSNTLVRSYPRGMDVECFSTRKLFEIEALAKKSYEREHVTPYFYEHPELFALKNVVSKEDDSAFRLTVDTAEDFSLIGAIGAMAGDRLATISLEEVIRWLKEHPEWLSVNREIRQKNYRQ